MGRWKQKATLYKPNVAEATAWLQVSKSAMYIPCVQSRQHLNFWDKDLCRMSTVVYYICDSQRVARTQEQPPSS